MSIPRIRALTIPSSGQMSDTVSPSTTRMIRQSPWSLATVFIPAFTRSAMVGTITKPPKATAITPFR